MNNIIKDTDGLCFWGVISALCGLSALCGSIRCLKETLGQASKSAANGADWTVVLALARHAST